MYPQGGPWICGSFANLMAYLCSSIGIPANTVWVWGGTQSEGYEWKYTNKDTLPTILVDPGDNDWKWHAVASTPEGYSDAALGVVGVNIVHIDPRGSEQYLNAGVQMTGPPSITYTDHWPDIHEWGR